MHLYNAKVKVASTSWIVKYTLVTLVPTLLHTFETTGNSLDFTGSGLEFEVLNMGSGLPCSDELSILSLSNSNGDPYHELRFTNN